MIFLKLFTITISPFVFYQHIIFKKLLVTYYIVTKEFFNNFATRGKKLDIKGINSPEISLLFIIC